MFFMLLVSAIFGVANFLVYHGSYTILQIDLSLVLMVVFPVVFPVTSLFVTKWRGAASVRSRVLVNHCWKTSSSLRTLVYECNTP